MGSVQETMGLLFEIIALGNNQQIIHKKGGIAV